MDFYKGAEKNDETGGSFAAIHVGVKAGPDAQEERWTFFLTVFFRLVALLWIFEGLEQWRRILAPDADSFLDYSTGSVAATIFFAVLNLIAAVGLWLVAPWGGVVWLLTLLAQVFVASIKPSFFYGGDWIRWFDGLLFALYIVLSWRANVASGEIGPIDRGLKKAHDLVRKLIAYRPRDA
ncbi:DUF6163 family protein [Rhodoblastus sp.]|uniref:DUF6163 family protein n=1 Tax=Rhodoblastus sp. TaxID=1962975 RepID=UPI003F9705B0